MRTIIIDKRKTENNIPRERKIVEGGDGEAKEKEREEGERGYSILD